MNISRFHLENKLTEAIAGKTTESSIVVSGKSSSPFPFVLRTSNASSSKSSSYSSDGSLAGLFA